MSCSLDCTHKINDKGYARCTHPRVSLPRDQLLVGKVCQVCPYHDGGQRTVEPVQLAPLGETRRLLARRQDRGLGRYLNSRWHTLRRHIRRWWRSGLARPNYDDRLARDVACWRCPSRLVQLGGIEKCGLCGCWLPWKRAMAHTTCPGRRWPGQEHAHGRGLVPRADGRLVYSAEHAHDPGHDCGCGGQPRVKESAQPVVEPPAPRAVLFRFPHGLGDAVQFTIVLQHLRRHYPDWSIDVATKTGLHTAFGGLARAAIRYDAGESPDRAHHLSQHVEWYEPRTCYADSPATKAEQALRDKFHLTPELDLCRYQIAIGAEARARTRDYLASLGIERRDGRYRAMLVHYQGNSARNRKSLDTTHVRAACRRARQAGYLPIVLDWDRRSQLVRERERYGWIAHPPDELWPFGVGDAESIAALASQVSLCLGIDSGPGHLFGATDTPTVIAWTRHHPLHYYCLAPNVLHLLPRHHAHHVRGHRPTGLAFFERHYRHVVAAGNYRTALPELIAEQLERLPC